MRNYLDEYHINIRFTNSLLKIIAQSTIKSVYPTTVLGWVVDLWPIWYNGFWILYYVYLIFAERAGLAIVCEQIWCLMTIIQSLTKVLNALAQKGTLKWLLKWCEEVYTTKHKEEYQGIVNNVFEKTNIYIHMCIRWLGMKLFGQSIV